MEIEKLRHGQSKKFSPPEKAIFDQKRPVRLNCPVLNDPTPVDVVNISGKPVGDLSNLVEPLDIFKEGEKLSIDDRIE